MAGATTRIGRGGWFPAFWLGGHRRASRWVLPLVVFVTFGEVVRADDEVQFVRDIAPLFARHCASCHGAEKQQGGLRLDLRADALAGGDSGKVIVPKDGANSTLIELISGSDPDRVMPPKGARLTGDEVSLVRRWIDQGAVWPDGAAGSKSTSDHWSFQAIREPAVPAVVPRFQETAPVRNSIDLFVQSALDRQGLTPSPDADRATLLRRLSLDVTGLPPTAAELAEFLGDSAPDAYERVVEKLLASPHFGERWGRYWLDLARYADSDGYEKDTPRPFAYRYRDWVINAINQDLPFDQFTIEQLAGDLLPTEDVSDAQAIARRVATGFHRNTLTNKEGGADQEEFRVAATVDRVNTLGAVWFGLTLGCAQCHTHKYDPIPQREYYQLFAYFNSIDETNLPVPTETERGTFPSRLERWKSDEKLATAALSAWEQANVSRLTESLEREHAAATSAWVAIKNPEVRAAHGTTLAVEGEGSIFATGEVEGAGEEAYIIEFDAPSGGLASVCLDALADDRLPSGGPGRVQHGNFVVSEVRLERCDQKEGTALAWGNAVASFEQGAGAAKAGSKWTAQHAIDRDSKTGWAISPQAGRDHRAVFSLGTAAPPGRYRMTIEQNYGKRHTLGRFRILVSETPKGLDDKSLPDDVVAALRANPRNTAQAAAIKSFVTGRDAEWTRLNQALVKLRKEQPVLTEQLAQTVTERTNPRTTRLLVRGDFLRPADEIAPGTLGVLPPISGSSGGASRLDLARWVVSSNNPLTPRVVANQWWTHLFGRGLVATPDDFGVRGERPSHPELLDWLALQLVKNNWSRKDFIRLVVHSHTYRQSARQTPVHRERDPRNQWLARQNRWRVEAEAVRDIMLSATGLLEPKIGGPSVRPPLPSGVAELGYAGSVKWTESPGADRYRRGLYIFFQRTVPYPMLMAFDSPDSNTACVRRERSNTPLQALTLLNDPVFSACADHLGRTAAKRTPQDVGSRVRGMFVQVLSREPSAEEVAELTALHGELLKQRQAQADADTTATIGVARVLLNLDETLVRE